MKSYDFRGVLHTPPFRPFSYCTAAGRTYTVSVPELAWTPPGGEVVAVAGPDGVELLGLASITSIAFNPDPPGLEGWVQRLRRLRLAEPFVPFVLHLADGRRIPVTRADGLAMSPDGSVMLFAGQGLVMLDADQITDVEPGRGAPNSTRS